MVRPRIGQGVVVDVPATTANLGPGFDCLGAALDLNNRFAMRCIEGDGERFELVIEGSEGSHLRGGPDNLVYRAAQRVWKEAGEQPIAVGVNKDIPAKSVKELIDLANKTQGGMLFAATNRGGQSHLTGELFSTLAGVQLNHIPYKSSTHAVIDLNEGRIDMQFGILGIPIQKEFGWTRVEVSFAFTIVAYMIVLVSPLQGFLADRFGLAVAMWLLILGPIALLIGLPRQSSESPVSTH